MTWSSTEISTCCRCRGSGSGSSAILVDYRQFSGGVNALYFTQGILSPVIRVRLVGVGSCVPVPVAGATLTVVAGVVVGDADG